MSMAGEQGARHMCISGIGLQGGVGLVPVKPLKVAVSGPGQRRFQGGSCRQTDGASSQGAL